MAELSQQSADRFRLPKSSSDLPSRIRASIQYAGDSNVIPVEIRDLSESGAGFVIAEPPSLKSTIVLSLHRPGRVDRLRAPCG